MFIRHKTYKFNYSLFDIHFDFMPISFIINHHFYLQMQNYLEKYSSAERLNWSIALRKNGTV